MKILSVLGYILLVSIAVTAITLSFRLYQKYRLKYLLYFFLSLLFGYAFSFLDVVASYLAQGILLNSISPQSTINTVRLIFSMLATPFIIMSWFFFILMIMEWLEKKLSFKLKTGYFILQIILIFTFALTVNKYSLMPDANIAGFSSMAIIIFNVVNLSILCLIIIIGFINSRNIPNSDKQKAVKIFVSIYLVIFILHFLLFMFFRNSILLCYIHLYFEFFMHIPALIYLLVFLKNFYKNNALHTIPEHEMAIRFAKYKISERELEIIRLILEGKSNHDIENELYISIKTVKTHIYNIYRKVGVKSRWQLINMVQNIQSS